MANIVGLNTPQIDIGQLGSAYLADADVDFTPPTGKVVVAILSLDNATKFNTLTPDNGDHAYAGTITPVTANGTNSDAIPATETFPAGVTIYGRWTTVQIDAGAVIMYFGE
tara:strand:+ start:421 stop:753 length:333 start_codon:yes stop_codon:yes gene_type:complete